MIIVCDLDGCLADFTRGFAALLTRQTGRVFPLEDPNWPGCWDWPQLYGCSPLEEQTAWALLQRPDVQFWRHLPVVPGAEGALPMLQARADLGVDDLYYLTHRPGWQAKQQSEQWLQAQGIQHPTVIVVPESRCKAAIVHALGTTLLIEDKPETLLACDQVPQRFLVDAPHNRGSVLAKALRVAGVRRVASVVEALALVRGRELTHAQQG